MRRIQLSLWAAIVVAVVGCGTAPDDDSPIEKKRTKKANSGPIAAVPTMTAVKGAAYNGVIKGKVTWGGDRGSLDDKINFTKDADYCTKGKEVEITQQAFRVGANGGLGNVSVWIEPAEANAYFEVPEDQLKPYAADGPKGKLMVRQPHCAFMPHCSIVFPKYMKGGVPTNTGQEFIVENDAEVTHNALIKGGLENTESNYTIAPGRTEGRRLKPDNDPVRISCGVHPWMLGYIRAYNHPYAALTGVGAEVDKKVYENKADPKFGTYEITGVPTGVPVRLKVWHEALEYLTPPEGVVITVKADDPPRDFTAKK